MAALRHLDKQDSRDAFKKLKLPAAQSNAIQNRDSEICIATGCQHGGWDG